MGVTQGARVGGGGGGGVPNTAWTAYTPAVTSSANPQPNLGTTGSAVGRWMQVGRTVIVRVHIEWGGTGIVGGGGGTWIGLPVEPEPTAEAEVVAIGHGSLVDAAPAAAHLCVAHLESAVGGPRVFMRTGTAVAVTGASPFVPATGDVFDLVLTYEAAA